MSPVDPNLFELPRTKTPQDPVLPVEVDTSLLGADRQSTGAPVDVPDIFLPVATRPDFTRAIQQGSIRQDAFSASLTFEPSSQSGASGLRGKVLDYAKQFLGVPYRWGGTSPSGFDCSGLLQYTMGKFGIRIPRVSYQQATIGKRTSISQLQPGDFVAFGNSVHHIAFYLGNGMILEAPRTGLSVRIRKLGARENAFGVHVSYPGE